MDIEKYINDAIFCENEKHKCFYQLVWANFIEDGFVITDETGHEIDAVFKAVGMQNLVGEFIYRLYDELNETGPEDVIDYLQNLGFNDDEIWDYLYEDEEIDVDDEDIILSVKNALDYITHLVANKMLDEFSADDLFDYMFTATYDFEQNFTFEFEDSDEFEAFVDSNTEQLDNYKEEFPSLISWIEQGMIC